MSTLDLSSWQTAIDGAEPVRESTLTEFEKKFSVCGFKKETWFPNYGMAEHTLYICGRSPKSLLQQFLCRNPFFEKK